MIVDVQADLSLHYIKFAYGHCIRLSFLTRPAEPEYTLPLQTCRSRSVGFLKPTDLDLHCLSLSMLICTNNLDQVI